MKKEWLLCPACKSKTRIMVREDTILKNFILYCPKCKNENLIDVKEGTIFIHKSQTHKMQSRLF